MAPFIQGSQTVESYHLVNIGFQQRQIPYPILRIKVSFRWVLHKA